MSLFVDPVNQESTWEWFVLRHSPGALFQSWQWGETQKRQSIPIERYGIYEGKTLRGVMQVALVRARRGTFLHVRHGPITDGDIGVWQTAKEFLINRAKALRCIFIRLSPLLLDSLSTQAVLSVLRSRPAAIHRMDGEYVWVLDLDKNEDDLLACMRKTTRYEIRRAYKEGVSVHTSTDPRHLAEFFDLYTSTSVRHGFVPHSGIREEFEVFAKKGQAELYLGKHEGKTGAAAIILYYGHQAIYHHGASLSSKVPISSAIQWEAIRNAKKRGMKVYNFWGISPESSPNHPWRGITLFKKGFGGREITYIHAQDVPLSPLYLIPRSVETLRRVLRGYD